MNDEELIKEACNKIEDHIFNNLCDDPDYFEEFMTGLSGELHRRWCGNIYQDTFVTKQIEQD